MNGTETGGSADPMIPKVGAKDRDESARLVALRRYDILDTPPEVPFDDLATLAAHLCGAPVALISFVASEREWFKARIGISIDAAPREISFSAHAILQSDVFVVTDASDRRALRRQSARDGDTHTVLRWRADHNSRRPLPRNDLRHGPRAARAERVTTPGAPRPRQAHRASAGASSSDVA